MAVVIRLTRKGSTHNPFYRIVVANKTRSRDGKFLEILGTYDPNHKNPEKQITLKQDLAKKWIENGAVPSETVGSIFKKAGFSA